MKKIILISVGVGALIVALLFISAPKHLARPAWKLAGASNSVPASSRVAKVRPVVGGVRPLSGGAEVQKAESRLPTELVSLLRSNDSKDWNSALNWIFQKREIDLESAKILLASELRSAVPRKRVDVADMLLQLGYTNGISKVLCEVVLLHPLALISGDEKYSLDEGASCRAFYLIMQYRLKEALSELPDLLNGNPNRYRIYKDLAILGDRSIIPEVIERQRTHGDQLETLGVLKASGATGLIQEAFDTARVGTGVKAAAAWALVQVGVEGTAFAFLKEQATLAINKVEPFPDSRGYNEQTDALKYIASIRKPEVQQLLEGALDSKNPVAREYAIANLLLRFPESQKAKDRLVEMLQAGGGGTFIYELAAAVDDAYVNAKAPPPTRLDDQTSFEWTYRVRHKDWSIYNWVHNYAVNYTRGE